MFKGKPVLRPLRREAAQARQVKKPRQQVVFGPARNLFAQTRPFVRIAPGRPIGALIAAPAFLSTTSGSRPRMVRLISHLFWPLRKY